MVYPYLAPCLTKEVRNEGGYSAPPESGLALCETEPIYCPRNPEESILYGVVAAQLETFLERQRCRDRPVPRFVERELRSFLRGNSGDRLLNS